ncbi:FLJ41423 protein [Homo sapiens]|jgi:hypothetical protein|uniref:Putative uncharacterized protein FLJ41423 n=1 Tax=Homo sapiens TaxID=9606 RepID=YK033_HUMAN
MAALSSRCPRSAAGPAYLQEAARSAHWASPPLVPLRTFQSSLFSSGSFHSREEEEEGVSLLRTALVGQGPVPLFLGSLFCAGCRQGPSVWSCGEPVPRRIWVTASVTPSPRQALHPCSDSLDILKALHLLPAAFSPFIWVQVFAEPSNKESRGENDGGEERESANIY